MTKAASRRDSAAKPNKGAVPEDKEAARAKAEAEERAAIKRAETVTLRAGVQPAFKLNIMPRPNWRLDDVPADVARAVASPQKLQIEFPITGTSERIAACKLPCSLSWLVRRTADGADLSVLVPGATTAVIDGNGSFRIEVDGRTPVLDILEAGLAGVGDLTLQVAFSQPHLGVIKPARAMPFEVDASVTIRWQGESGPATFVLGGAAGTAQPALFGTNATVAVATSAVLDKVGLAVEIFDGEGKAIVRWLWEAGKRHSSVDWSMGFSGPSYQRFSNLKPENGLYAFGCRLLAVSRGKERMLLSKRNVVRVQQPLLTDFSLTFSPGWLGSYRAAGKIARVIPEADLKLAVALVDAFSTPTTRGPSTAPPPSKLEVHEVTLQDDGTFSAALGPGHFHAPLADANDRPVYAILSFPAAQRSAGVRGPVYPYLAFNDDKFALWEGGAPTWLTTAGWIASEEAPLAARGERPPALAVNVLAPPADMGGDPYGPLTAEIAYADLRAWEGEYAHMYRDSAKEGYVTVGCGIKVDNPEACTTLPFVNKLTGAAASEEEKRDAFAQILKEPRHKTAGSYANRTNLVLPKEAIVDLAKKLVDKRFIPELQKIYGADVFDGFPLCVRRALVDMAYNAGTGKMPSWEMTGHIRQRNWQLAAQQVPTAGRQERRSWRCSLLLFAASLPPRGGKA